jgi:hypothetical protein
MATRIRPGEYEHLGFIISKRRDGWLIFDLSDPAPFRDPISFTRTKGEAMRLVNGWADARARASSP